MIRVYIYGTYETRLDLTVFNEIAGWSLHTDISAKAEQTWKEFIEFLKENVKNDYENRIFERALDDINRRSASSPPEYAGDKDLRPYMIYTLSRKREIELLKEGVSNEKLDVLIAFMLFAADKETPFNITIWKDEVHQVGIAYNRLDTDDIGTESHATNITCKDGKIEVRVAHVNVVWEEVKRKK